MVISLLPLPWNKPNVYSSFYLHTTFLEDEDNNNNNKYARPSSGTAVIHTCRAEGKYCRSPVPSTDGESTVSGGDWRLSAILAAARRFVRFWASGRAKFPKMGDSLHWTPTNHRAKFAFILAGEIRNRTNKQTNKQVRPSSGTDVIHGFPRMPVVLVASAKDYGRVAIATLNFTSWCMADLFDLGLLGKQSSPKLEIPCPGRP